MGAARGDGHRMCPGNKDMLKRTQKGQSEDEKAFMNLELKYSGIGFESLN